MGLMVGSVKPKIMRGSDKVKAVYKGDTKLWASTEPFVITFTESTTWVVPDGVDKVDVFLVGGGGAGGYGLSISNALVPYGGGGGGGGYTLTRLNYGVVEGQEIAVVIGAGGKASSYSQSGDGGVSSFGTLTVNGGKGGYRKQYNSNNGTLGTNAGGAGGSGGGGGNIASVCAAGVGGSDGATPPITKEGNYSSESGTGQGTTTRAFGESTGTLYAGGGGGGGSSLNYYDYTSKSAGAGGLGGGGKGGTYGPGTPGTPNTGGGGGGGGCYFTSNDYDAWVGGDGGSGVVIVRYNG